MVQEPGPTGQSASALSRQLHVVLCRDECPNGKLAWLGQWMSLCSPDSAARVASAVGEPVSVDSHAEPGDGENHGIASAVPPTVSGSSA